MPEVPQWVDPYSPEGVRKATAKILTGTNYRVFFESNTRLTLIEAYRELAELARQYPQDDDAWRAAIRAMVEKGTLEDKRKRYWLMGLAKKTAQNLGAKVEDYPAVFDEMMSDVAQVPPIEGMGQRDMALLMWCGAATLTIRGALKSRTGKTLERSIARAALTIIGLNMEDGDFRLNIGADQEVERETDAEVKTPRGYIRIEVGMIGTGNPEVISDKVGRLDRNDVILFDALPPDSQTWETARNNGVVLIQLRNNNSIGILQRHLKTVNVEVEQDCLSSEQIEDRVLAMPLSAFT